MKDRRGLPRRAAAAGYTHRLLDAVKSVDIATTRAESATMRANDVATIAERLPRLRKARSTVNVERVQAESRSWTPKTPRATENCGVWWLPWLPWRTAKARRGRCVWVVRLTVVLDLAGEASCLEPVAPA